MQVQFFNFKRCWRIASTVLRMRRTGLNDKVSLIGFNIKYFFVQITFILCVVIIVHSNVGVKMLAYRVRLESNLDTTYVGRQDT